MAKNRNRKKRDWQPREQRLVSEYIAKFYSEHESRTHVHLGSVQPRLKGRFLDEAEARMLGTFRRWADALVLLPDRIVLIEGKILPQPGVISQLELYAELIPKTPELAEHKHKPIEKVILCAIEDPQVTAMARKHGCRVVTFKPAWLNSYMKILHARERTPSQSEL
ncbi:hypothetical protein ES705_38199 [subsurface metagenome]